MILAVYLIMIGVGGVTSYSEFIYGYIMYLVYGALLLLTALVTMSFAAKPYFSIQGCYLTFTFISTAYGIIQSVSLSIIYDIEIWMLIVGSVLSFISLVIGCYVAKYRKPIYA